MHLLQQYELPAAALPASLQQMQGPDELPNELYAAILQDPAAIAQTIVDRGRIDGAESLLSGSGGGNGKIRIDLVLYRDAAGAQADLHDFDELHADKVNPEPAPVLGDASILIHFMEPDAKGQPSETVMAAFTVGRLEVVLQKQGQPGSVQDQDVLPLAAIYAREDHTPPPPPGAYELALLQEQTQPEAILSDGYGLLLSGYATALAPSTILSAAYQGAVQALAAAGVAGTPAAPAISSSDPAEAFNQFFAGYQKLESVAGTLSLQDLAYAALAGMYDHLNCHTHFYPPQIYGTLFSEFTGQSVASTGIEFTTVSGGAFTVLRTAPGSPADQAGLKSGDQVTAINQQTPAQAGAGLTDPLAGIVGTSVTLTIARPGTPQPFDVTLTLQNVSAPAVTQQLLPGGVGYLAFDEFAIRTQTSDAVQAAMSALQRAGRVNGWILDLRSNIGGSPDGLARTAGLFVPAGSLLLSQTSQDGTSSTLHSIGGPVDTTTPLIILVGPDTASSAEIFTESLKDLGRATVVGSQTMGCVDGGNFFGFLDTSGAFLSTVHVLAGPNAVALEGEGVTPDQVVGLTSADLAAGTDPQLAAAMALLATPGSSPQTP